MSHIIDLDLAREIATTNRTPRTFADDVTLLRQLGTPFPVAVQDEPAEHVSSFPFIGKTLVPGDYARVGHYTYWWGEGYEGREMIEDVELPEGIELPEECKCAICGAAHSHVVLIQHKILLTYHTIGFTCASTLEGMGLDQQGTKEVAIRKIQAAKKAAARQAVLDANPGLEEAIAFDNKITKDIAERWATYGTISEKQVALVIKIMADAKAKAEAFVASGSKAAPEGRTTVTLEVVTIKETTETVKAWGRGAGTFESHNGWAIRFRHADGWEARYSGTSGMFYDYTSTCKVAVGDTITLTATFEQAKGNKGFAFLNRPTPPKTKTK
jgi:hypothetical protein